MTIIHLKPVGSTASQWSELVTASILSNSFIQWSEWLFLKIPLLPVVTQRGAAVSAQFNTLGHIPSSQEAASMWPFIVCLGSLLISEND